MSTRREIVREIAWHEVFPWLILVRAFRISVRPHLLLISAVCLLITTHVWINLLGPLFDALSEDSAASVQNAFDLHLFSELNFRPSSPLAEAALDTDSSMRTAVPYVGPLQLLLAWRSIFNPAVAWSVVWYLLLGEVLGLAVWAYGAGLITRIAVVDLAREERIGIGKAVVYVNPRWPSYFASPTFPLVGVAFVMVPLIVLGWIMRLDAGVLLAGIVWPLVLIGGLFVAILLLGLLFGWPFFWVATSADNSDAFDAVSRAYSYVFQRPLHLLFYACVSVILGWLGWLLVAGIAAAVIQFSLWGVAWGLGTVRIQELSAMIQAEAAGEVAISSSARAGASLIALFHGGVRLLVSAYLSSYLLVAASGIYLLVREHVDGKDPGDVFSNDEAVLDLPPWDSDEPMTGPGAERETRATDEGPKAE